LIDQTISHYRIVEKTRRREGSSTELRAPTLVAGRPEIPAPGRYKRAHRHWNAFAVKLGSPPPSTIPNCTIYQIDKHDDHSLIAMEFLDGTTLKMASQENPSRPMSLLEGKPLPFRSSSPRNIISATLQLAKITSAMASANPKMSNANPTEPNETVQILPGLRET
jgi:hypothetical protein